MPLGTVVALSGACDSSSSLREPPLSPQGKGGGTQLGKGGNVSQPNCDWDLDEDGYCEGGSSPNHDCDDGNPARNPGATEILDLVDDDCDGTIDEGLTPECSLTLTAPQDGCEAAIDLVTGFAFACVLTSAGRVLCWGNNSDGALGTPDIVNVSVPVAVPGLTGAKALLASSAAACAFRDKDAVCWGAGAAFPFVVQTPPNTIELAISYATQSSGRYSYSLYALDGVGQVWVRDFISTGGVAPKFAKIQGGVKRLVGGGAGMCAITTEESLICNLGAQATTIAPAKVDYATKGVDGTLCYITEGALYCASGTEQATKIEGNGSATGVAVSSRLGCAINAAGKLACWKSDGPTTVEDAVDLAVGNGFGCILRQSGKLSCWGNADGGQLGDGRVNPSINEREPVDVLPSPTLELPAVILLSSTPLGACDSAKDVAVLGNAALELHAALAACKSECQDRLDTVDCFAGCAANPGLSAGCFDCYITLASCSGADCYAAFNACAGYPVDFAYATRNSPRFDCAGAECLLGAGVGQACSSGSDCLTGMCNHLPQAPDSPVCAAADGASCSAASAFCECRLGTAGSGYGVSGHCGGCYGEGRVLLSYGSCVRECWKGGGYCSIAQSCQIFSNSITEGYCG